MGITARIAAIVLISWLSVSESVVYRKEHSFAPPSEGQADIYHDWFFAGNAAVHEGLVRLTAEEPMTQGAIWSAHPCFMKDWEMQVIFRIYGQDNVKYGNGIAIWYTMGALQLGPVFGSRDNFVGLGVFIDTYENTTHPHLHRHPYISAVINNGSFSYKHDERGTFMEVGSCHVNVRNKPPNVPTAIAVSYMQNTLSVFMDTEGLMNWAPCFRAENVHLPRGYFFGISASTGWLTDFHDIITVSTLDMSAVEPGLADTAGVEAEVEPLEDQEAAQEEEINRLIDEVRKQDIPSGPFEPDGKIHVHKEAQIHEQKAPPAEEETKAEMKQEPQKQQHAQDDPKKEKIEPPSKMSWLKIFMYGGVITVVGIFAVRWFSSYNARRKEKLRKRLY